jgi:hypothetical protein
MFFLALAGPTTGKGSDEQKLSFPPPDVHGRTVSALFSRPAPRSIRRRAVER